MPHSHQHVIVVPKTDKTEARERTGFEIEGLLCLDGQDVGQRIVLLQRRHRGEIEAPEIQRRVLTHDLPRLVIGQDVGGPQDLVTMQYSLQAPSQRIDVKGPGSSMGGAFCGGGFVWIGRGKKPCGLWGVGEDGWSALLRGRISRIGSFPRRATGADRRYSFRVANRLD